MRVQHNMRRKNSTNFKWKRSVYCGYLSAIDLLLFSRRCFPLFFNSSSSLLSSFLFSGTSLSLSIFLSIAVFSNLFHLVRIADKSVIYDCIKTHFPSRSNASRMLHTSDALSISTSIIHMCLACVCVLRAEYDNSIFAVKVKLRNVKNLNGFILNVCKCFLFPHFSRPPASPYSLSLSLPLSLALFPPILHRLPSHTFFIRVGGTTGVCVVLEEIYYRLHTVKLLRTWVCSSGIIFFFVFFVLFVRLGCCCFLRRYRNLCETYG